MTALSWLNDLMVWLSQWVPRLVLIKSTHEGVLFGRRGSVSRVLPGLCWYWPITGFLQLVGMRRRSLELAAQLHQGEAVSLVIVWCVTDALVAATKLNDAEAYLDDRVQAALSRRYVSGKCGRGLCDEILVDLREEFAVFGVDILAVDVAQRSWVIPLKNLSDYATHSGKGDPL